jgi:ribosomal protein S18 acetylase RimI-like enzyme
MTLEQIEIRPCRVRDIEGVLALWVLAASRPGATDTTAVLRMRLRRDRDLFLVALDGARVVGSVMGGWDGWRGQFYRLAVAPEYRRIGLASRVVTAVEERLRALGVKRIGLLVVKNEPAAVAFWKSRGYVGDRTVERYAKNV